MAKSKKSTAPSAAVKTSKTQPKPKKDYALRSYESSFDPNPPSIFKAFLLYFVIPIVLLAVTNNVVFLDKQEEEAIIRPKEGGGPSLNKDTIQTGESTPFQNQQKKTQGKAPSTKPKSSSDQSTTKLKYVGEEIEKLRVEHANDPNNIYKALKLADKLRAWDYIHHDGGSIHQEAISTYQITIQQLINLRNSLLASNKITTQTKPDGTTSGSGNGGEIYGNINDEMFLDSESKSIDGLLLHAYCALGKQYYMANMFEKSVLVYDDAIALTSSSSSMTGDVFYLDALSNRATSLVILGKYVEAARDYTKVLELDGTQHLFVDVFTGMAKILVAKEKDIVDSGASSGWDHIVGIIHRLLPEKEKQMEFLVQAGNDPSVLHNRKLLADQLKRMHLALFSYHDVKTNDTEKAWEHLNKGHGYKMSTIQPYNFQLEQQKVDTVKQIFNRSFFPENVGSQSNKLIFIVGFPRSGSTLLERVLDAHPSIVGTGEDSVFNGMLGEIRDAIVKASVSGSPQVLQNVLNEKADKVVRLVEERWELIDKQTEKDSVEGAEDRIDENDSSPQQYVDKMLTNYMNIGFIHMLFPKALILHVVREPMDTVFSAFKQDFPAGGLDYSSDFKALQHMFKAYCDIMTHWDEVLPGRVKHVRYEDMVHDMPNMAQAIIGETELPWYPEVLDFHKKKHAVNTLSTTQVRKAIYKDSLKSWQRYETHLQPLVQVMGRYGIHTRVTTLNGYKPIA